MIISTITIKRIENSGNKMIGVCSLTIDSLIAIHDIKILRKDNNMFLAMPSKKIGTSTFKDVVHPISVAPRKKIEELIFYLYNKMEKLREEYQVFQYTDEGCCSLFDQSGDKFETSKIHIKQNFVNDEIRREIESWMV